MTDPPLRGNGVAILVAYVSFALVGVTAGVSGVLLPAQIRDYGVDKAIIGLTFFAFGAGFLLAGLASGELLHRFGVRTGLVAAGLVGIASASGTALRPPFVVFIALGVLSGYGIGTVESLLNVYLTGLRDSTGLLGRLHGCFGVGALLGPLLAALMLRSHAWTSVWLLLALAWVPVTVSFAATYPREVRAVQRGTSRDAAGRGLLSSALRQPAVTLAALFLAIYVGIEIGVGNWGYSYLVGDRGQGDLLAGYTVSGYWLGLTLGRFAIGPIAARLRLTASAINYGCVVGVAIMSALIWVAPFDIAAALGFLLLGFCLGPVFPTAMAVVPSLTQPRLVATAIGVINGLSILGGAVFPWLAGSLADAVGIWTLLPFAMVLALVLLAIWWQVANRLSAPA